MSYILNEDWHGMERMSPEWCRVQVGSLARVLQESRDRNVFLQEDSFNGDFFADDLDTEGLIAMLDEMAEARYDTAESYASLVMEHLLYLRIAPNNDSVIHWQCEVSNFLRLFRKNGVGVRVRRKAGNANIKKELTENWSEIYEEAVGEVRDKAENAKPFTFKVGLIPETVPWTVDDFLEKNTNALVAMIH